jgi:apolipoprotein D and lipocalin family protein
LQSSNWLNSAALELFYGEYWIIDLAADYSYAVVDEPRRRYLWILTSAPLMIGETCEKITRRVQELCYDPGEIDQDSTIADLSRP